MPMLCTLSSSSSGNCTLVSDGRINLLIDAGISARRILAALSELHIDEISAVLLTHEHTDHIAGLRTLVSRCRVPVYASGQTAAAVENLVPGGLLNAFEAGDGFEVGSIGLQSFPTPHDTPESVGYLLSAGSSSAVVATDLGCVPPRVLSYISEAGVLLIEANHDIELLKNGPYPGFLKKRILSDHGHLSNAACAQAVAYAAEKGKLKKVLLGHLSAENNTPSLALAQVAGLLDGGGISGGGVSVEIAPRAQTGPVCAF
jgi:phosphoribosyl 1,2-cyclic phosphodiesterase